MTTTGNLFERLDAPTRELLRLCDRFASERGERAYLVGGRVRDLLLGRDSMDIDVVVVGDGMAVAQALSRQSGGKLTRFHSFGTARVDLNDGRVIDFATARRESYTRPGQLPQVQGGTLQEDLARRDFSINALALALAPDEPGQLIDEFGGVADLDDGLVRILHEGSFIDDATRMLRAVRFQLRFGYRLEAGTEQALAHAVRGGYVDSISGARLRREVRKLYTEAPVKGPLALAETGLLKAIQPGLEARRDALETMATELQRAPSGNGAEPWSLVLAATAAPLNPQQRWTLRNRLRLSRSRSEALMDAGAPWERVRAALSELRSPGERAAVLDSLAPGALRVVIATDSGVDANIIVAIRRYLDHDRAVAPSLDGAALQAMGCPEGPALGEILRALRVARIDEVIVDRPAEEVLARRLIEARAN
jgi:tRNA nucleotidyltransferase (CCA-adding enzyme)